MTRRMPSGSHRAFFSCAGATRQGATMSAIQTVFTCEHSVDATITAVRAALAERGIPVFAHFDHAANAAGAGLALPATQVLVFGAPAVGTLLMQAFPAMALELPLRMACWQQADGVVKLSVPDMAAVAARYGAQAHPVIAKMQALLTALAQAGGGR